jgi:hypothetical protein
MRTSPPSPLIAQAERHIMKTPRIALLLLLNGMLAWTGFAQGFSSGSTGADGALDVGADTTISLPPDGILNYTTINVIAGATLSFSRNPLNTPVYLLATGDITIAGTIDVSGKEGTSSPPVGGAGGPGGFDGGMPGFISVGPGAGYGPGAGQGGTAWSNAPGNAGSGGYSADGSGGPSTNHGSAYGSPLLVPLLGGSGGGGSTGSPGVGGGGGGGAVLLASNTRILITGAIQAQGGRSPNGNGNGSGGAIRLVAPEVAGTGTLNVSGGRWATPTSPGRIRIDTIERRNLRYTFTPLDAANVGSYMAVFPASIPKLDITQAAGTAIPEGNPDPVTVQLPFDSDPNQTVTVQARNFGKVVPVRLVLTPDSGLPLAYDAEIDNTAPGAATTVIPVVVPLSVRVSVHVYTR